MQRRETRAVSGYCCGHLGLGPSWDLRGTCRIHLGITSVKDERQEHLAELLAPLVEGHFSGVNSLRQKEKDPWCV